jgi:hypothetical protein
MTTHEYDAHCESLVLDDRYHEDIACTEAQIQDEAEMKEAYDAALRRHGAKDALKDLQLYLLHCGCHQDLKAEVNGIIWSLNAIKRRLDDLELTPETGGNFPHDYFEEIVAEGGSA